MATKLNQFRTLKNYRHFNKATAGIGITLFTVVGTILLFNTRAAAPFATLEPENGTLSRPNLAMTDSTASGGSAVRFGVAPPPTGGACPAYPAFPDANCTGWQHTGVTLTTVTPNWDWDGDGDDDAYRITTDGTTIDGKDFNVFVCIAAHNVTITRSRVRGGINMANVYGGCIYNGLVAQNLTLRDVEVDGGRSYSTSALGGNITCIRCNIHSAGTGVNGQTFTLEDSFVHDLFGKTETPPCTEFPTDCWSHNTAVLGCCQNITIRHSNLEGIYHPESQGGGMSSALSLYSWSPMNNVLVEKNRFKSVAVWCAYGGNTHDRPPTTNVRFIDNVFVKNPDSGTCGMSGPIGSWIRGGGNLWQNNTFNDGVIIPEPDT